MKKLKELLNGVNVGKVYGDTDREIGHIHFDSRKIEPGDVFIAQRGVNADGHAFIDKALTRGAVAVVCEQLPENRPEEVTYIWTADTSEALGVMAGNYWDNPSRELKLVGVTGTNERRRRQPCCTNWFDWPEKRPDCCRRYVTISGRKRFRRHIQLRMRWLSRNYYGGW